MGSSSDIDFSIASIYQAWRLFRRGKKASSPIQAFEFNLEHNVLSLAADLQSGQYQHDSYHYFEASDSKRRTIAVAQVRDRVVHRLLYEYLVACVDKQFAYHVWSCRAGKGLRGAINATQKNMYRYRDGWLWRSDIRKFFDSVDHEVMMHAIQSRVPGVQAQKLCMLVLGSYGSDGRSGLAIGNLTSQILANVYLNEFDRYVLHVLKPLSYIRYGDDFILWVADKQTAGRFQRVGTDFLSSQLRLDLQPGSTVVQPLRKKLHYLGAEFFPGGRRLDARARQRVASRSDMSNSASYHSLVRQNMPARYLERYNWQRYGKLDGL